MRFDKAYCIELEKPMTPYFARDLFFDEESKYYNQKLHFRCEDDKCKVELVGVNIYNDKKNKKALHYRTKPKLKHDKNCSYFLKDHELKTVETKNKKEDEGFKITQYPSVFLLNRPKSIGGISGVIEIEEAIEINKSSPQNASNVSNNTVRTSILKTSCLDNLVDCYLNGDKYKLNNQPLTIGTKTKYFNNFFKNIKYFQDEEGLIYWGEVKEVKKFGQNYSIIFKDKSKIDNNYLTTSIYIENHIIEKYRKRKLFRNHLDELINSKERILCFFVGSYPEVVEVKKGDLKFKVLDVKISNLDHISFTFE